MVWRNVFHKHWRKLELKIVDKKRENFRFFSRMKTSGKIKFEKFSSHSFRLQNYFCLLSLAGRMLWKYFSRAFLWNIFTREMKVANSMRKLQCNAFFLFIFSTDIRDTYGQTRSNSSLLSTKLNSDVAVKALICLEHCISSSWPHGWTSLAIMHLQKK